MKYIIGIDLGTTNTVVYYLDKEEENPATNIFKIPQITAPGEVLELEILPSFLYLPDTNEIEAGSLDLPWRTGQDYCVGEYARKCAATQPLKIISSTKSWLCADNVEREGDILPWNRTGSGTRISPVEASRRILAHIRDAWNYKMASGDESKSLEKQEIILTVPASFDAVARELTVRAAEAAGLKVILLEEPLAAFYAWIFDSGENWRKQAKPLDVILVCDIGGGTSDFSLIKTIDKDGNLEFERIAVGRHILLGGDNMDLAMAYTAAAKLQKEKNIRLDNYQLTGLRHECRAAKEKMLSGTDAPSEMKLTVLGRGSGVVKGALSVKISKEELENVILDGFFPKCSFGDKPSKSPTSGFKDFGLNYESDPAITKHLSEFLSKQDIANFPNLVVFNGGVTKAASIRKRIMETLLSWGEQANKKPSLLEGSDPDLAVAKGASRYGLTRHGKGVRIKAGSSHAYYVGIESSLPAVPGFSHPVQALCVVPLGMEEGTGCDVPYEGIGLIVGQTTEFKFYASTTRKSDLPGSLVEDAENCPDIIKLAPLSATLPTESDILPGTLVPVRLRCELTETGTLQVWCFALRHDAKWKLDFELRAVQES